MQIAICEYSFFGTHSTALFIVASHRPNHAQIKENSIYKTVMVVSIVA